MAGERTLPGLGLTGFWTPGSVGWGSGMNANLLTLSAVAQLSVIAISALPGSPVNGDIYINTTAGANVNKVAVRDNGAWVYLPPQTGWSAYNRADGKVYVYNGTSWAAVQTPPDAGGIQYLGLWSGASAVASFDVDLAPFLALGYEIFEARFRVAPSVDGTRTQLRVSNDGGSSFLASGYHATGWAVSGSTRNYQGESTTEAIVGTMGTGNATHGRLKFRVDADRFQYHARSIGHWSAFKYLLALVGGRPGSGVNALRFFPASGNFNSYDLRLYGFRNP